MTWLKANGKNPVKGKRLNILQNEGIINNIKLWRKQEERMGSKSRWKDWL